MTRTIRALLVGIDNYRHPVPPLNGCGNDIGAFAEYLGGRAVGDGGSRLALKVLKDEWATHEALIAAFRGHLKPARKGDVALFYCAEHGSQEQAAGVLAHRARPAR
jgi:hypothetical protein